MYYYLPDREIARKLKSKAENIIKQAQIVLREYFTFSFKLIGSGKNNMITYSNENKIDLDYNLIIQKDKKELISNPQYIRSLFIDAFKKACGNDASFQNKKNVICCNFNKKIEGFTTSIDCAILLEQDDKYLYKIHFDKDNNAFIWNKIKESHNRQARINLLRYQGKWNDVRKKYLELKNDKKYQDVESYRLLLQAVNDIYERI